MSARRDGFIPLIEQRRKRKRKRQYIDDKIFFALCCCILGLPFLVAGIFGAFNSGSTPSLPAVTPQNCSNCSAGRYNPTPNISVICLECPAGQFSEAFACACESCAPGESTNNQTESSACTPCSAGFFAPAASSPLCTPCAPGSASNMVGSSILCPSCNPGFIAPNASSTECTPCSDGFFQPAFMSTTCLPCPLGEQGTGPVGGATSCVDCPAGSFSNVTGTIGGNCSLCTPGFFAPAAGATACQACAAGTFSAQAGATQCTVCEVGFAQVEAGQTECDPCAAGSFAPLMGALTCTLCPPGSYQNETGAAQCDPCPPGTFNMTEGQTSIAACALCEPGQIAPSPGSQFCMDCLPGFIQPDAGQTECEPCLPGTAQLCPGQNMCKNCSAGYFQSELNATTCVPCPMNQYQPEMGQTECLTCPNNTFPTNMMTSCGCGLEPMCHPLATCVVNETFPNASICECNPGFQGDGIINCSDCNECLGECEGNTCAPNATCTNTVGSFTCACETCWLGDGFTCTDPDQCADEGPGNNCDPNALCNNTYTGSCFTCECSPGYFGDGFTCTLATCANFGAEPDGAESSLCTGSVIDDEVCCVDPAGPSQDPTCACASGREWNASSSTCIDVDECAVLGGAACGDFVLGMSMFSYICHNVDRFVGGNESAYTCSCPTGFVTIPDTPPMEVSPCTLSYRGAACEDINECNETLNGDQGVNCVNSGGNCTNIPGGFICTCPPGQVVNNYTGNCVEDCDPGYMLNLTSELCVDIDECALSSAVCESRRLSADFECIPAGGTVVLESTILTTGFLTNVHCFNGTGFFCSEYLTQLTLSACGFALSQIPCSFNDNFSDVTCQFAGVCAIPVSSPLLTSTVVPAIGGVQNFTCAPGSLLCEAYIYDVFYTDFPILLNIPTCEDLKIENVYPAGAPVSCPDPALGPIDDSIAQLLGCNTSIESICAYPTHQNVFAGCAEDTLCGTGTCVNTPGSFQCTCTEGTTFDPTTQKCQDTNACIGPNANNTCIKGCLCEDRCGGFHCNSICNVADPCGDSSLACRDIETAPFFECSCAYSGNFCGGVGTCVNAPPSLMENYCVNTSIAQWSPQVFERFGIDCGLPISKVNGFPEKTNVCCNIFGGVPNKYWFEYALSTWCANPPECYLNPTTLQMELNFTGCGVDTIVTNECDSGSLNEECVCDLFVPPSNGVGHGVLLVNQNEFGDCALERCVELEILTETALELGGLCNGSTAIPFFDNGTTVAKGLALCCENNKLAFNMTISVDFWLNDVCQGYYCDINNNTILTYCAEPSQDFCGELMDCAAERQIDLELSFLSSTYCPSNFTATSSSFDGVLSDLNTPVSICCPPGFILSNNISMEKRFPIVPQYCQTVDCVAGVVNFTNCSTTKLQSPAADAYCIPGPAENTTCFSLAPLEAESPPAQAAYFVEICNVSIEELANGTISVEEAGEFFPQLLCCQEGEQPIFTTLAQFLSQLCPATTCAQNGTHFTIAYDYEECNFENFVDYTTHNLSSLCGVTPVDECFWDIDNCVDPQMCIDEESGFSCAESPCFGLDLMQGVDPDDWEPLAVALCTEMGFAVGVDVTIMTELAGMPEVCCQPFDALTITNVSQWPIYNFPNSSEDGMCSNLTCVNDKGAWTLTFTNCDSSLMDGEDNMAHVCGDAPVNECQLLIDTCIGDEECEDLEDGFSCTCEGIQGTNQCTDPQAVCQRTLPPASLPYCECLPGYTALFFNTTTKLPQFEKDNVCVDVNECLDNEAFVRCSADDIEKYPGFEGASCVNTEGSYVCECLPPNILWEDPEACDAFQCVPCPFGTQYDANATCVDINECLSKPCDSVLGSCINFEVPFFSPSQGSETGPFLCSCPPGFRNSIFTIFDGAIFGTELYSLLQHKCIDIDECLDVFGPPHGCPPSSQCVNYPGGYECVCDDLGFELVVVNASTRTAECQLKQQPNCPTLPSHYDPCTGEVLGNGTTTCVEIVNSTEYGYSCDCNGTLFYAAYDLIGYQKYPESIQQSGICQKTCTVDADCTASGANATCDLDFQCTCAFNPVNGSIYVNGSCEPIDFGELCATASFIDVIVELAILSQSSVGFDFPPFSALSASIAGLLSFGISPASLFSSFITQDVICNPQSLQLECAQGFAEPMCCNLNRSHVGTFGPQSSVNATFTAPRCLCNADSTPRDAFVNQSLNVLMTDDLSTILAATDPTLMCDSCSPFVDPGNCECVKTQLAGLQPDPLQTIALYDVCSCAPIRRVTTDPVPYIGLLDSLLLNHFAENLVVWDGWMQGDGTGRCVDRNECEEEHWSSMCHPNATCHNLEYDAYALQFIPFLCLCPEGMIGDGMGPFGCQPAVPCRGLCDTVTTPEGVPATCTRVVQNVVPDYLAINFTWFKEVDTCVCPTGYELQIDENEGWQCVDIDECEVGVQALGCDILVQGVEACIVDACLVMNGTINQTANQPTCRNLPGSWSCECCEGFELVSASLTFLENNGAIVQQGEGIVEGTNGYCRDVDECCSFAEENGTAICADAGKHCLNTFGSFSCGCDVGETTVLSYDFFNPFNDTDILCLDVNECVENSEICGPFSADCKNLDGNEYSPGFTCSCAEAAQGTYQPIINDLTGLLEIGLSDGSVVPGSCVPINECDIVPSVCDANSTCEDLDFFFHCICPLPNQTSVGDPQLFGFVNQTCVDCPICEDNATCTSNVKTNFQTGCECPDLNAYYDSFGNTNSCLPCPVGACPSGDVICVNYCECPSGYERNVTGEACVDIDECVVFGPSLCAGQPGTTCTNTNGSFTCVQNVCNSTLTCHAEASCVPVGGGGLEVCVCNEGFSGDGILFCEPCPLDCGENPNNVLAEATCVVKGEFDVNGTLLGTHAPECQCSSPAFRFDNETCQCVQKCEPACLYADYCVPNPLASGEYMCSCPNGVGDGITTCSPCCQHCADFGATCKLYQASSACGIVSPTLVNQEPHLLDSPTAACVCPPNQVWCDFGAFGNLGNGPTNVAGAQCPNLWYRTSPFGFGVAIFTPPPAPTCRPQCGAGLYYNATLDACVDIDECALPMYDVNANTSNVVLGGAMLGEFTCVNLMAHLLRAMPETDCPAEPWVAHAEIETAQAIFFARQVVQTPTNCTNFDAALNTTTQPFAISCPGNASVMTLQSFEAYLDTAQLGMRQNGVLDVPPRCSLHHLYYELLEAAQCCMCDEGYMWDATLQQCRVLLPVCEDWNFDTGFGGLLTQTSGFGVQEVLNTFNLPSARRLLSTLDETVHPLQQQQQQNLMESVILPMHRRKLLQLNVSESEDSLLLFLEQYFATYQVERFHALQSWKSDNWVTELITTYFAASSTIFFSSAECFCPWQRTQPLSVVSIDGMQNQICPMGGACMTVEQRTTCMYNECHDPNIPTNCEQFCIDLVDGWECQCAPGFIVNVWNASQCDDIDECLTNPCSLNEFCLNTEGSFICNCNPGFGTDFAGDCLECVDGEYSNAMTMYECEGCPEGTRGKLSSPRDSCIDCDPGRFTGSGTGATGCFDCLVGRYQPNAGEALCLLCDEGKFANETGLTACFNCEPGFFSGSLGATVCTTCVPGTFQNESMASECEPCPAGQSTFGVSLPFVQCEECALGFSTNNMTGESSCVSCPENTFANETGLALCFDCPEGKFGNLNGATSEAIGCQDCEPGFASSGIGLNCTACSVGFYTAFVGSSGCTACELGRFQNVTGETVCLDCLTGTFANVTGLEECFDCPGSTTSPPGSVDISECV